MNAQPTVLPRYSFTGHETFPFRYAWLPKGVRAVQKHRDLFNREDALVVLGVGKNMVKSIRHWCETLELIEASSDPGHVAPTALGRALFGTLGEDGWDPYLEDPGTLWLLHWKLVSRRDRASTWYLAFTKWNSDLFTRDSLTDWLLKASQESGLSRATRASIRRDVEVFIRTYVPSKATLDLPQEDTFDCPLVELGLLEAVDHGPYRFVRGPKPPLPDDIFLYALLDYWRRERPTLQTLPFEAVLHGPGSPGGAFQLSENALAERLERITQRRGAKLAFDETAGMRLVLSQGALLNQNLLAILERYYSRTPRTIEQ